MDNPLNNHQNAELIKTARQITQFWEETEQAAGVALEKAMPFFRTGELSGIEKGREILRARDCPPIALPKGFTREELDSLPELCNLFASLLVQIADYISRGRDATALPPITCRFCSCLFVPTKRRTTFCSARCSNRASTRRFHAKQKESETQSND